MDAIDPYSARNADSYSYYRSTHRLAPIRTSQLRREVSPSSLHGSSMRFVGLGILILRSPARLRGVATNRRRWRVWPSHPGWRGDGGKCPRRVARCYHWKGFPLQCSAEAIRNHVTPFSGESPVPYQLKNRTLTPERSRMSGNRVGGAPTHLRNLTAREKMNPRCKRYAHTMKVDSSPVGEAGSGPLGIACSNLDVINQGSRGG